MKRLTILFLFTLVTAQTGFKKSISIDCFNLPLGTLPLHLSFINDDGNMELNIPIYYQLFGKNSPIAKYTGITKMFMTGINVRKFPNKSKYGKRFFWGFGSRLYYFEDNPKESIFGDFYKDDKQTNQTTILTLEPDFGYQWSLDGPLFFRIPFGIGVILFGMKNGELVKFDKIRPAVHFSAELGIKF